MSPETREGGELSSKVAAMTELARQSLGSMSERESADALAALAARFEGRVSRQPRRRLVLALAGGLAVAAALVILRLGNAPLTGGALGYEVDGATIENGGLVHATSAAVAPLVYFSDGTVVSLSAGAQARIATVDAHGAQFRLEGGELRVHVMHRKGARWAFQAGPFQVDVTGTSFSMGWREEEGRLDVRMQRGTVSVSGPLAQDPITVRAGQQLTLKLHEKEVVIREAEPATAPPAIEAVAGSAPPPHASAGPGAPAPRARPLETRRLALNAPGAAESGTPPPPSWTSLLAAGDLQAILDDARRTGIEAVLRTRDGADLAALADAARYRGQTELARRALLAQMKRFPGTARARDAAFHLGRMEESAGATQRALGWYQRYLAESPDGVYASEALGREMGVLQSLRGQEAARAAAEQYLRRFPTGSYAHVARALTRAP